VKSCWKAEEKWRRKRITSKFVVRTKEHVGKLKRKGTGEQESQAKL